MPGFRGKEHPRSYGPNREPDMSSKIVQFKDNLNDLIYGTLEILGPTYEMYHQRFKLGNQIIEVSNPREKGYLDISVWVDSEEKTNVKTSDPTSAAILIYNRLGY